MNLETEIDRELWQAVRRSYESQVWSNAVLDSIHYLSDVLRAKSGLESDGTALVGQALGGKAPKLRLNRLETQSEKDVQAGVEQLLRGIYQSIRNPRSHERLEDTQVDADALIVFVNYLLKLIGHARAVFSIDECVGRILDKNFVSNERYATLLVEEIPARNRLQVALTVFHRKSEGDGEKLRYYFDAVIAKLSDEEGKELFQAISTELRESNDDESLRFVIQLLNPTYWPRIDEVARLRTENRLISNLEDGRYKRAFETCSGGALATWAQDDFWKYFSLKAEMLRILVEKLRSESVESQDYVLRFYFFSLDILAENPPFALQKILAERLKAGDSRFKDALDHSNLWGDERWNKEVQAARESFRAAEPPLDEDIPF
jgi:uncharacterized protein (TIGR02391 family)